MTGTADEADGPVVETAAGALRGRRMAGVGSWRGIPYAAPPVGSLRFRAPRPAVPWHGVRDARDFRAAAPQPVSPAERLLGLDGHGATSEDCLTLNVWSRGPGGPPRPVLVWLHGGSYLTGAGSDALYDGHGFAARGDLVVVTLNYRLGPLGFLHLGGAGAPPGSVEENLGLRDQIAALAWVRDNIAAFGGDPAAVTLCGQSAGAMAAGTLLGVPEAHGLFARAILQSGAARHVHDRARADRLARAFLGALGLRHADMAVLRGLPAEALVGASRSVTGQPSLLRLPFQPLVDGLLLPRKPLDAVRDGAARDVPLLIGTTRDELTLYTLLAEQAPSSALRHRLGRLRAAAELAATLGLRRANRLRRAYPSSPAGLAAFAADAVFRIPALALAEAQAVHAPVFAYRFDWPSPAYGGRLGACHALDVPFVWHTTGKAEALTLVGDDPTAPALAGTMHDAWIAFARTGRPEITGVPDWPPYDEPRRATAILDRECRIEDDPEGARRRAWFFPS